MARGKEKQTIRSEYPKVTYPVNRKGYQYYLIDARKTQHGRIFKQTKKEALDEWQKINRQWKEMGSNPDNYDHELRLVAIYGKKSLGSSKKVKEAIDHYLQTIDREERVKKSKLVKEAVALWLEHKGQVKYKLARRTLEELRGIGKTLTKQFGEKRLLEVETDEIDNYISSKAGPCNVVSVN